MVDWKTFLRVKEKKVAYALWILVSFFVVAGISTLYFRLIPLSVYYTYIMYIEESVLWFYFWPMRLLKELLPTRSGWDVMSNIVGIILTAAYFYVVACWIYSKTTKD